MIGPTLLERLAAEALALERENHPGTPASVAQGQGARHARRVVTTLREYVSMLEAASSSSGDLPLANALGNLFEILGQ